MAEDVQLSQRFKPNFEEAKRFIGRSIVRCFVQGVFRGDILGVEPFLDDDDTNGPFYHVKYEDEEEEHLTWEEIEPCLEPNPSSDPSAQPLNSSLGEQLSSYRLDNRLQAEEGQQPVPKPITRNEAEVVDISDDDPSIAAVLHQQEEVTTEPATQQALDMPLLGDCNQPVTSEPSDSDVVDISDDGADCNLQQATQAVTMEAAEVYVVNTRVDEGHKLSQCWMQIEGLQAAPATQAVVDSATYSHDAIEVADDSDGPPTKRARLGDEERLHQGWNFSGRSPTAPNRLLHNCGYPVAESQHTDGPEDGTVAVNIEVADAAADVNTALHADHRGGYAVEGVHDMHAESEQDGPEPNTAYGEKQGPVLDVEGVHDVHAESEQDGPEPITGYGDGQGPVPDVEGVHDVHAESEQDGPEPSTAYGEGQGPVPDVKAEQVSQPDEGFGNITSPATVLPFQPDIKPDAGTPQDEGVDNITNPGGAVLDVKPDEGTPLDEGVGNITNPEGAVPSVPELKPDEGTPLDEGVGNFAHPEGAVPSVPDLKPDECTAHNDCICDNAVAKGARTSAPNVKPEEDASPTGDVGHINIPAVAAPCLPDIKPDESAAPHEKMVITNTHQQRQILSGPNLANVKREQHLAPAAQMRGAARNVPGSSERPEVIDLVDDDDHSDQQAAPATHSETIEILDDDDDEPEVSPPKRRKTTMEDYFTSTPEIPRIPRRPNPAAAPRTTHSPAPSTTRASTTPNSLQGMHQVPAATQRIWRSSNATDVDIIEHAPPSPVHVGVAAPGNGNPRSLPAAEDYQAGPSRRLSTTHASMSQMTPDPSSLGQDPQPSFFSPPLLSQPANCSNEGKVGHLCEMKLENFMCHQHLRIPFGPNVNFISGSNGSGKSAILQGLQCCLGVTARNTGRALNLTHFIRSGSNQCKVRVTIWNTGEDAYKPQEFGNKITIERVIYRTGNSKFSLFAATGRQPKATTRQALESLLDHLCVNAANPLTVLTQDCSRDFLAGNASDKRKFELFMEGTALKSTETVIGQGEHFLANTCRKHETLNEQASTLKAQYDDLKKRVQSLEKLDEERAVRDHLEKALPWSLVVELRRDIQRVRDLVNTRYPADIEEAKRRADEVQREIEECERKQNDEKQRLVAINTKLRQVVESSQRMRESERKAVQDLRNCRRQAEHAATELAQLQKEQQDLQTILQSSDNAASAEQQQLLQVLSQKVDVAKDDLSRSQHALEEWRQKLEQANQEMEKLRDSKRSKVHELGLMNDEVSRLQQQYVQLTSGSSHSVARFGGAAAQRVQELIEQRLNAFHRPPVGPVGMLLRLTAEECWASCVELALKGLFDGYICHDGRDAGLMRQIMKTAGSKRMIYTLDFGIRQHHIPATSQPPPQDLTVLRAVACTDPAVQPVVVNIMVDQAKAESTMLVETSENARDVMYKGINGYFPTRAYEQDGYRWSKPHYGVSCEPCHLPSGARLRADNSRQAACVQEQLQQLQAKIQALQMEVANVDGAMRVLQQQHHHIQLQQRKAAADVRTSRSQMFNLERESREVQQRIESESSGGNEVLSRLASLSPAIAAAEITLDTCRTKVADAEQHLLELQQQNHSGDCVSDLEEQSNEVQAMLNSLSTRKQVLTRDLEARKQEAVDCEKKMEVAVARLQECLQLEPAKVAEAMETCEEAEGRASLQAVREWISRAEGRSVRNLPRQSEDEMQRILVKAVEGRMKFKELLKELHRLTSRIQEAELNAGGQLNDLQGEMCHVKAALDQKKLTMKRIATTHNKLWRGVNKLKTRYGELKREMAHNVKLKFRGYMKRKGHSGELTVNWEEEKITLEVRMNVHQNPGAQKVTDLKQLSGGERSFTTVCFILAMAEYTDTPFRCMDEYDVFMDAVNRRISTEVLLEFALESKHLQYIFLTPQDIHTVEQARRRLEQKRKQQLPNGFLKFVPMKAAREAAGHESSAGPAD